MLLILTEKKLLEGFTKEIAKKNKKQISSLEFQGT